MAKIETYISDSNITGGDKVIGTDVNNANATKNYLFSDILAYMSNNITNFVPYTGATGNVDLGIHNLSVGGTTISNNMIVSNQLEVSNLLSLNGNEGLGGEFLTSQGAGNAPAWTNPLVGYVPYIGATTNVDLGSFQLSAFGVDVKTGPLFANGNAGVINQILTSNGVGVNPTWQTPPFVYAEYASFYSTQTQVMTLSDGPTPWTFNNTDISSPSISIQNNLGGNPTRITSAIGGVYNIQFSVQFEKLGGGDHTAHVWFRKNGVDIPNSNTNFSIRANSDYVVGSLNFFVSLNAGQYVEILWVQDGDINIKYEPANAIIPYPATPSIILTVNRVSIIP